jgi:hypothetical protein
LLGLVGHAFQVTYVTGMVILIQDLEVLYPTFNHALGKIQSFAGSRGKNGNEPFA